MRRVRAGASASSAIIRAVNTEQRLPEPADADAPHWSLARRIAFRFFAPYLVPSSSERVLAQCYADFIATQLNSEGHRNFDRMMASDRGFEAHHELALRDRDVLDDRAIHLVRTAGVNELADTAAARPDPA